MLSVWSPPSGNSSRHLEECVLSKTRTWVSRIKNSALPTHLVWRAYRYQLWPALQNSLGTLVRRNDATPSVLYLLEFEMLAPMGVNRHVKADWRTKRREFGKIGLYSLPVEQVLCWFDLFLQHYQTSLTVSSKLRASLEALQLKLGCRGNPLLENFSTLGCLATDSWLVAV